MILKHQSATEENEPRLHYEGEFVAMESKKKISGDLLIYNNGMPLLKVKNRPLYQVKADDCNKAIVWGGIKPYEDHRGSIHTAVALIPDLHLHREYNSPSSYCLIQRGILQSRPTRFICWKFREDDPIEFDKVRFDMDGLHEFTKDAFSYPSF